METCGTKLQKDANPDAMDILRAGRDMMNRSTRRLGVVKLEECRFQEMFDVKTTSGIIRLENDCRSGDSS